jgi:putative transcriptional regulator
VSKSHDLSSAAPPRHCASRRAAYLNHAMDDASDLSGRLLVAMPGMGDPRFTQSVVLVCAHSDQGAMGLIVNKPAREIDVSDLLQQLEIEVAPGSRPIRVHFGGPVECGRGFVLHSTDYEATSSTLQIDDAFGMTATLDILHDIARGDGPGAAILALGYAGWGPGQLEGEIRENGWLVCDASSDIVFGDADEGKWQAALKSLGIDALLLSSEGGRA